jgi:flagellar basal-body rod modification protein FlgD
MNVSTVRHPNTSQGTTQSGSQLNMDTFLALLTVQLSTQNPMEPMNDRDFFAQLAQLGQVQGTEQMNRQLGNFGDLLNAGLGAMGLSIQDLTMLQSSALVGKGVTATHKVEGQTDPVEFNGKVERVFFKDGQVRLSIKENGTDKIIEVGIDELKSVGA